MNTEYIFIVIYSYDPAILDMCSHFPLKFVGLPNHRQAPPYTSLPNGLPNDTACLVGTCQQGCQGSLMISATGGKAGL